MVALRDVDGGCSLRANGGKGRIDDHCPWSQDAISTSGAIRKFRAYMVIELLEVDWSLEQMFSLQACMNCVITMNEICVHDCW